MVASSPAGRVLNVLERLQERPGTTGPRLARELGVSERTIRRYVATLQNLGIPVEPTRGRIGGYRLKPGYRMPPLMFSTDEAVAVTLALAMTQPAGRDPGPAAPDEDAAAQHAGATAEAGAPADGSGVEPIWSSAASTALGKLDRVLPREVARSVETVRAAVFTSHLPSAGPRRRAPEASLLVPLAEAVVGRRTCRIRHTSQDAAVTVREVNPYGVVIVHGAWYLHAWCHLRQARRTFRLDRVNRVDILRAQFSAPTGLDVVAAVEESLALDRPEWAVTMLVHAPQEAVAPWVPRDLGVLEPADADVTRLRSSTRDLDYFAWRIGDLPFAMTVVAPDELRTAFFRHAERLLETARGYARTHD